MKIAIVDDALHVLDNVGDFLLDEGYEVLTVKVEPVESLEAYANQVKMFAPDVVLLDHELDLGDQNGATLAELMGFPKDMLVGTSTTFSQNYCGKRFGAKDKMSMASAKKDLLAAIERRMNSDCGGL